MLRFEEWRLVPGFRNYAVSNFGEVKNTDTGYILSPGDNGHGYLYVNLYDENHIPRRHYVHRLISMAFHDLSSDMEVNHRNGYKAINFEHNLEPVTRAENIRHAYAHKLIDLPRQRANVRPVRVIETGEVYESAEACARAIGGLGSSVRIALRFENRSHLGLRFEYADGVAA